MKHQTSVHLGFPKWELLCALHIKIYNNILIKWGIEINRNADTIHLWQKFYGASICTVYILGAFLINLNAFTVYMSWHEIHSNEVSPTE